MAYFVLHHQGYGAWTTYTNGAYKQYEGGSVTVQPAIVGENVIPGLGGGTNGQPYTLPNGQSLGSLNPLNPSDWAKAIGEGLTAGLGTLLGGLIDVAFWKRVGMGLLGIVIMVIGLTILLRRDIAGAVRTASGTAAVAA
jgi:hypothetical protein